MRLTVFAMVLVVSLQSGSADEKQVVDSASHDPTGVWYLFGFDAANPDTQAFANPDEFDAGNLRLFKGRPTLSASGCRIKKNGETFEWKFRLDTYTGSFSDPSMNNTLFVEDDQGRQWRWQFENTDMAEVMSLDKRDSKWVLRYRAYFGGTF